MKWYELSQKCNLHWETRQKSRLPQLPVTAYAVFTGKEISSNHNRCVCSISCTASSVVYFSFSQKMSTTNFSDQIIL